MKALFKNLFIWLVFLLIILYIIAKSYVFLLAALSSEL